MARTRTLAPAKLIEPVQMRLAPEDLGRIDWLGANLCLAGAAALSRTDVVRNAIHFLYTHIEGPIPPPAPRPKRKNSRNKS